MLRVERDHAAMLSETVRRRLEQCAKAFEMSSEARLDA